MYPTILLAALVEFIVDYFGGRLLDRAIDQGMPSTKSIWEIAQRRSSRVGTVKRVALINHEVEMRALRTAISSKKGFNIIYLYGPGGVGKTRLLEEAGKIASNVRLRQPKQWGGIIDPFHADLHSNTAIHAILIQNLDPHNKHFVRYRDALQRLELRRREGFANAVLDSERNALDQLFVEEYNRFAQMHRVIIAFDTLESITHESDLVQQLCLLKPVTDAVSDWLLHRTSELHNTTIILAGRPDPYFLNALQSIYEKETGRYEKGNDDNAPKKFDPIDVKGLIRHDFNKLLQKLFQKAPKAIQKLADYPDQLFELTKGYPVQLALLVELAALGDEVIQRSLAGSFSSQTEWSSRLVNLLFDVSGPTRRLFFFLALARRGLDANLLHYLEPAWSLEECSQRLETIRSLSIVKIRPAYDQFFLHDVLYELFDSYVQQRTNFRHWQQRLVDYYQMRANAPQNSALERTHQKINLFYYLLHLNPKQAFEHYLHWSETALKGHEIGFDLQLRDELLRFLRLPDNLALATRFGLERTEIDLDSAARWVKRYLVRQRSQVAIQVAESILLFKGEALPSIDFALAGKVDGLAQSARAETMSIFSKAEPLFWAHLLVYYGEALVYTGVAKEKVQTIVQASIHELNTIHPTPQLEWLYRRTLGRAHNTLGYLLRAHGHYGLAVHQYQLALAQFNSEDSRDEFADTQNNLAFVLAILGAHSEAREAVKGALEIRRKLGQRYPIALGHNTRGRIYTLQSKLAEGSLDCEWALQEFQSLEDNRGVGLAQIALGLNYRQQAISVWENARNHLTTEENLRKSESLLEKAIQIFSTSIREPLRLWEAYNELGSLYRDWSTVARAQDRHDVIAEKIRQSLSSHQQALEIARNAGLRFQEADTCDDIAHLWFTDGNKVLAQEWLDITKDLVPYEFTLQKSIESQNIPSQGEAFWLILGKIHYHQSNWALHILMKERLLPKERSRIEQDAIQHLVLSHAYLERYWPATFATNRRVKQIALALEQAKVEKNKVIRLIKRSTASFHLMSNTLLEAMYGT